MILKFSASVHFLPPASLGVALTYHDVRTYSPTNIRIDIGSVLTHLQGPGTAI